MPSGDGGRGADDSRAADGGRGPGDGRAADTGHGTADGRTSDAGRSDRTGSGDDRLTGRDWAARAAVGVAVAVVVAFALGVVPGLLADTGSSATQLDATEYDVSELGVTQIPAEGSVEVNAEGNGTVVIDRSHTNRFSRADVLPLYEALSAAGMNVEFHDRGSLEPALANASAFVVIDPGSEYGEDDTETLRRFADSGGHVLVLAEPNRVQVSAGLTGVTTSDQESEVSNLGAAFGLSFSTAYVYHQSEHDGNYKRPLASPVNDAAGVGEDVALSTAAVVRPLDDTDTDVVLRTRPGSRLSSGDRVGSYPVAVRTGNVTAVGDTTFLRSGNHLVADNEGFLAYLAEFLIAGEAPPAGTFEVGDDSDDDDSGADGGEGGGTTPAEPPGDGTATPDGTPTGTPTPAGTPTPEGTPTGTPTETPGGGGTPET